jgi:hypothetical protein
MVGAMAQPAPTRTPGSFLGYQYPEWLFMLLVMFLPLLAAVLRHVFFDRRGSALGVLGWTLLYMVAGFVLWLLVMLIIFKLYERKEKRRSS